jgi:hypothetical protein
VRDRNPVENCPVFRFKKFPLFGTISRTEFEGKGSHEDTKAQRGLGINRLEKREFLS